MNHMIISLPADNGLNNININWCKKKIFQPWNKRELLSIVLGSYNQPIVSILSYENLDLTLKLGTRQSAHNCDY